MSATPAPASPPPRAALAASIAAPVLLYLAHVALYLRHVNDDAYITFRYARFLATGHGPYFNPGEHVEGYTNFLHMVLMAAAFALGGEAAVPVAAKAVGIVSGAAALVLAGALARHLARAFLPGVDPVAAGALAASLVAVFPGYALNSTSGLETTLYAALVTAAVWLGARARARGRWTGAGAAWAGAALTRPEGPVVFAVAWIADAAGLLAAGRGDARRAGRARALALDAVTVVAVVAAHLVFRLVAYDGEWLPNTWWAKAEGFFGETPWSYVRRGALGPFGGIAGVVLAALPWTFRARRVPDAAPVLAVAAFGALLPFLTGADWMPGWRFSVPWLPALAAVLAAGALAWLAPLRRPALAGAVAVVAVTAGMIAWHGPERRELHDLVRLRAAGYATGHRALAAWIREQACEPGDTVALMDIGIVGYYCPRQRILDITGLTDRHIAKSPGALLRKRFDLAYVFDREPRVIVLVVSSRGDPSAPIGDDAELGTWIRTEAEILADRRFAEHWVRRPPAPPPASAPWTERLAARLGAARVFEHAFPGQHYVLAAFVRKESAPPAQESSAAGSSPASARRASSSRARAVAAATPSGAISR